MNSKPRQRIMPASKASKPRVWCIQPGTDEADLFLDTSQIAVGWPKMGDLSLLETSREAFRQRFIACCLDDVEPRLIPIYASQLLQFVHRIAIADIAVYPSKFNGRIYIGQVTSRYYYNPGLSPDYPHLRRVQWLAAPSDEQFSLPALREIRFPMSVFQVRINAGEVLEAIAAETEPSVGSTG